MSDRYIFHSNHPTQPNDWESARKLIAGALAENIEQVERHKRTLTEGGVYIGLSGIALMESKIAAMLTEGLDVPKLSPDDLERLVDKNITYALRIPDAFTVRRTRVAFLETGIGTIALAILRYRTTNAGPSDKDWTAYTAVLDRAVKNIIHEDSDPSLANDDGCEVLYGRAGLLYSFLLLRNALRRGLVEELPSEFARQLSQLVSLDNVWRIVDSIILRGRRGGAWLREDVGVVLKTETPLPPLMWSWHQTRYLGAAHGVAGILQMLLTCPAEVVTPYTDEILNTIRWLISIQDETGNWPSSFKLHRHRSNDLVHWCHGAPGILILLSTVLKLAVKRNNPLLVDDQTKTDIALSLHRGAVLVYKRGFLRKGLGLCHGVAGSVYSLLAVDDVSNEIQSRLRGAEGTQPLDYLGAAIHMSTLATRVDNLVAEKKMAIPDRPWSLYEGRAGMCCAWAVVLHRIQTKMGNEGVPDAPHLWGFPGYSDLEIEP